MDGRLLVGLWRAMIPVPRTLWEGMIMQEVRNTEKRLDFMTAEHRTVHHFVVKELPCVGGPVSPEFASHGVGLPVERVNVILGELEAAMTFLFRNEEKAVSWAYPVTADETPHRVTFGIGEQVSAAWAVDAIATPFVQGQLWGEDLSFVVDSMCADSGRPIQIEIDSELTYRVVQEKADPRIFVPIIDVERLDDPSIIDAFWSKSVFFWSEEHAKRYRRKEGGVSGLYLTMDQAVLITRVMQTTLFGLDKSNWVNYVSTLDR